MKKMQTVHWLQSMTDLVWKTNKKNVVVNVPDGAFAEEKRIGKFLNPFSDSVYCYDICWKR